MRAGPRREPEINKLFRMAKKHQASHLYLAVGLPPMVQLKGVIREMEMRPLSQEDMERLLHPIMNDRQRQRLDERGAVEFAYVVGKDEYRFGCNVSKENGQLKLSASPLDPHVT